MSDEAQVEYSRLRLLDDGDEAEAWLRYQEWFSDIDTMAANRHLMTATEFQDMCNDRYIEKHVARVEGRLVGLSVITGKLASWPLISPRFFERRWPDLYAQGRLWYIGFVGVARSAPRSVFSGLLSSMAERREQDTFFLDFCTHNVERGLPRHSQLALRTLGHGVPRLQQVDAQTFWSVDFPDTWEV